MTRQCNISNSTFAFAVCTMVTLVACLALAYKLTVSYQQINDMQSRLRNLEPACSNKNDIQADSPTYRHTSDIDLSASQDLSASNGEPQDLSASQDSSASHGKSREFLRRRRSTSRRNNRHRDDERRSNEEGRNRQYSTSLLLRGGMMPMGVPNPSTANSDVFDGSSETTTTAFRRSKKPRNVIHFEPDQDKYQGLSGDTHLPTLKWWKISDWCSTKSHFFNFNQTEGVVTILQPGVYFLYIQVTYKNNVNVNSFSIRVGTRDTAKCILEHLPSSDNSVTQSCYTGFPMYLNEYETVQISNKDSIFYRPMMLNSFNTFWGILKL